MKGKLVSAVVLILMLAVAACAAAAPPPAGTATKPSGKAEEARAKPPEPLVRARTAGVPALEAMSPTLVASQKGFFKEANLEVGDMVLAEGGRVREALVANEVEFIDIGIGAILIGIEKGLPIRVVAGTLDTEIFGLWVRDDLRDKVKSVKDLRGLTVGVPSPGSAMWVASIYYLKQEGLGEKDVNFVALGSVDPAVFMSALEMKRLDAAGLHPTALAVIQPRGLVFPLVDITKPEALRKYFGDGKSTSMVIVTRQDLIAGNPQLVQRRLDVHKKALQFIASHTSLEVAEAAAPGLKMDVELASRVVDQIKGSFSDGRISRRGIEAQIEMAYQAGVITKRLKYEEVVDDRFLGTAP